MPIDNFGRLDHKKNPTRIFEALFAFYYTIYT